MKITMRNILLTQLLVCLSVCTTIRAQDGDKGNIWNTVYQDDYNYSKSVAKFNTWFWREDFVGNHTFNVTNVPSANCTAATPCVKLTSPVFTSPQPVPYINAEMYNNSCLKGKGIPWSFYPPSYYTSYVDYCNKPYPYRPKSHVPTPVGVVDSWNTPDTGVVSMWKNPLDKTSSKPCLNEPCWEWYRDLFFNVPYLATPSKALKISMGITAEGKAGGSRGWGLWNTTMSPADMQMAWFMEISTQGTTGEDFKNTVLMMTIGKSPVKEETGICVSQLDSSKYDIYDYHSYTIEWLHDAVTYFVDGDVVAQHINFVPDRGLPFHNWADNRNYIDPRLGFKNYPLYIAKTNYINGYVVQEANNPPHVSSPVGQESNCVSIAGIIEKDIWKWIIAWIIEHELGPGPVIPPGAVN